MTKNPGKKTIIISNRLPVKIIEVDGKITLKPSEGGLATGLSSLMKEGQGEYIWIGWPGKVIEDKKERDRITKLLVKQSLYPIYLTRKEVKDFYEGFSNETLWPNFHYFNQYVKFDDNLWNAYEDVNRKFCNEALPHINEGDTLWIHDYQLLLLPGMIREKIQELTIGFFQHIPFPSYESFRILPCRKKLLEGMLGADLIGFHTYDDMRHFLSSVNRLVGIGNKNGQIDLPQRAVRVDAFPMGIDYDRYEKASQSPETLSREVRYRTNIGTEMRLVLSIDRLDYSKGIPQRLKAFERFLEYFPEYREKVSLLMLVVPSRDTVSKYREIKESIDELVGRVNGKYGRMGWTPIIYFYRSLPLHALSAFYRMAEVMLVTPMRDGMNLVCKEYVASKIDKKGVLILSEMAGASKELSDATLVNPNDLDEMTYAIKDALEMPEEEQIQHIEVMQKTIKRFDVYNWVKTFMNSLTNIKKVQKGMITKSLDQKTSDEVISAYKKSANRLIFLDYDGTLVGFTSDPQHAKPDDELKDIISVLTKNKKNKVVIISGRDRATLSEWFDGYNLDIICEHGVWLREGNNDWQTIIPLDSFWKDEIRKIMNKYLNRTPGALIEEKDHSLVWHYRKVETGLGELRTRELTSHLKYVTSEKNLQVMEGNMVIEIKSSQINKGIAANKWAQKYPHDFILAIGDDWTDEDTFKSLPESAFTIKVGGAISAAKYSVRDFKEVRKLLASLK